VPAAVFSLSTRCWCVKLGPLDGSRVADLRPYLNLVPDPRARRVRGPDRPAGS
jgi:hypothetical protein